jgi:hypothetical protein
VIETTEGVKFSYNLVIILHSLGPDFLHGVDSVVNLAARFDDGPEGSFALSQTSATVSMKQSISNISVTPALPNHLSISLHVAF